MAIKLRDQEARQAALDLSQSYLVQAPAGSGKTGLLVQRLLMCLSVVDRPEQILALTFTRKAAAEMRHRVAAALRLAAGPRPNDGFAVANWEIARKAYSRDAEQGWNLAGNPGRLRIQTIDSLNQYLAAQAPLLSGLGAGTTTEDARLLYRRAVLRLFAALDARDTPAGLRTALQRVLRHADNRLDRLLPLLESLLAQRDQWLPLIVQAEAHDSSQWNQVLHDLILARLRHAASRLPAILANQFAACIGEVAEVGSLPWTSRMQEWPPPDPGNLEQWRGLASLLLTAGGKGFRKKLNSGNGIPRGEGQARTKVLLEEWAGQGEEVRLLLAEVLGLPDPAYPESLEGLRDDLCRVLAMLVAELHMIFADCGEVDFAEVASRAQWALRQGEQYTPVMERQDQEIHHLLIDEMQDTSLSQVNLLRTLTEGWTDGDGRSLFMVGDPMQSIYAFRQADVRLFLTMMEQGCLGSLPLQVLKLSSNFRSQQGLVEWFNGSFSRVFPKEPDGWTGLADYEPAEAVKSALPGFACQWFPAVHTGGSGRDNNEAEQTAAVVQRILSDAPNASIAILVRARSHLPAILGELQQRGIRYQCQDVDPVQAMPAVADALGLIRSLWQPADVTAWTVALRAPFVGMSWADLTALATLRADADDPLEMLDCLRAARGGGETISNDGRRHISRFLDALDAVDGIPGFLRSLPDRVQALWGELGGPACYTAEELADVQRLFQCLAQHCPSGQLEDIRAFNLAVSRLFATPGSDGVQVMTMHKAKGLEFDHVLLPGLGRSPAPDKAQLLAYESLPEEGFLLAPQPPADADDFARKLYEYVGGLGKARRRAEMQRLLYVAATRARERLYLFATASWSEKRGNYPSAGSLLEVLWPLCEEEFADLQVSDSGDADAGPRWLSPRRQVLPADWLPERGEQPWHETIRKTAEPENDADTDSVATMIGEMYHAAMQKMLETEIWEDCGESRIAAMSAGFRRLGMPEPRVLPAVRRVVDLLRKTLNSEAGRWLLQSRVWARTEYPLQGKPGQSLVNARIDLCFLDGEDYWVVDYKAAAAPVDEGNKAAYIRQQRERYKNQLERYAELLAAERGVEKVRTALFLPELGSLEVL